MTGSLVTLLLIVATAAILRWRRPAWYWMTFGVTLAALRVAVRYASVMDAADSAFRLRVGVSPSPG